MRFLFLCLILVFLVSCQKITESSIKITKGHLVNKELVPSKEVSGYHGGIWVANSLSNGRRLLKYTQSKSMKCKLFEVEIGNALYSNSYRTKTNKVKLIREV